MIKKLLKKLFDLMIEIGSTIINIITIGSTSPTKIDWGSDQVWPYGGTDYINLPSTGGTIGAAANYAYISNISASTNSWTVSSNQSWLTVTKTSNTQARYDVTENTALSDRTGVLSFKIGSDTYATYTVRQTAAQLYIVVSPTFVNLTDGLATGGTITVSSNTADWTVATASEGFTATKTLVGSTYVVRWTVTENTTGAQRIGYINVSYGSVTATTQINQSDSIYVFTGLTTNPMTIGSAATSFTISLVSRFGQTITEQPTISIGYNPDMNVQNTYAVTGGTVGQWNFGFTCNANNTDSQRTTTIVFTQPGSNKTLTYVVNQSKRQSAPSIGDIVVKAYDGNWVIGTLTYSYVNLPVGQHQPVNGIVIAYANQIPANFNTQVNMEYQNGPTTQEGSPNVYNVNTTYAISSGDSFNYTNPDTGISTTYYGKLIISPSPRQQINQVVNFEVTQE